MFHDCACVEDVAEASMASAIKPASRPLFRKLYTEAPCSNRTLVGRQISHGWLVFNRLSTKMSHRIISGQNSAHALTAGVRMAW
jgi:hypothetical protein